MTCCTEVRSPADILPFCFERVGSCCEWLTCGCCCCDYYDALMRKLRPQQQRVNTVAQQRMTLHQTPGRIVSLEEVIQASSQTGNATIQPPAIQRMDNVNKSALLQLRVNN